VGAVSVFFQLRIHLRKDVVSNERMQEFVMSGPRFMRTGYDRVDNSQLCFAAEPLVC